MHSLLQRFAGSNVRKHCTNILHGTLSPVASDIKRTAFEGFRPPKYTNNLVPSLIATRNDMISSFSLALPLLAATVSNAYYDHRIVVGGPNTLTYTPNSIKADVGDTITFE
jgi:hypothetical protein